MRTYENPDGRCLATALANVFLLRGESRMAQKVFTTYPEHPLIADRRDGCMGTLAICVPKLVRDLTDGEFQGIVRLTGKYNFVNTLSKLFSAYPVTRAIANTATYTSTVLNSTTQFKQPIPECYRSHPYFETPTVVFTDSAIQGRILRDPQGNISTGTFERTEGGHALVALPAGLHIDNGYLVQYPAAYTFLGHLELNRS